MIKPSLVSVRTWLVIGLIIITVPSLPISLPSTLALELPSGPTPWRPYGPYVREVQVSVFLNEALELDAFEQGQLDWFDWIISPGEVQPLVINPDALVSPPVPESSLFWLAINHHASIFGIAQQRPRTDFATIDDDRFDGLQSLMEPTEAGIHVRQAITHVIDRASFARDAPGCTGGSCVALDDPISALVCLQGTRPTTDPQVEPCTTLAQRQVWDTLHITCPAGSTTPCAYKVATGPGGGVPSEADLQAAREHLSAAGLADTDGDGRFDWPGSQIIFAIRNDDSRRLHLGTVMADALDSIFETGPNGEPVVNRIFGGIVALGQRVLLTEPADDWHLYTNAGSGGLLADDLYVRYDSAFASDVCGGDRVLLTLNHGFYCNPAFDEPAERGFFRALTVLDVVAANREAADIAGKTVLNIPAYTRAHRTIVHNGWDGVVNVKGDGFLSSFNWLNMRQKPSYCSTPPNCDFLGPPGGGNLELLRAGFRQGTSTLNIFHAGTFWESHILFNILDSPGGFNPRGTRPFVDQYEKSTTQIREEFNDFGADQVPGNTDDDPVTVLELVFRNDLLFHDGLQLTARDLLASGLAYRDVPAQGFGLGHAWSSLLDAQVPIPGSNCGNLCIRLVFRDHAFQHKQNVLLTPILPLHLWDAGADGVPNTSDAGEGDGFICSGLRLGSCIGRATDRTTDINFDPMVAGIMVGHGPFMCLNLATGRPGGSCSRTALGIIGGQRIGSGGGFTLTPFDEYVYGSPTVLPVESTPLGRFTLADVNKDWKIDVVDFALASGNLALQALIHVQLDFKLGGPSGKNLNEVDTTNEGNAYPVA